MKYSTIILFFLLWATEVVAYNCNSQVVHLTLDEAALSTTFVDSAGGDDDATCTNCPTAGVSGQVSTAVRFNGTSNLIDLDGGDGVNPTFDNAITSRTVMLWFNADDTTGTQIIYEEGGGVNGMNIYLDGTNLRAGAWSESDGWNGDWMQHTISSSTWYHVALVFDSYAEDEMRLYINGVLEDSIALTTGVSGHTGNDWIGGSGDSGTKLHTGDSNNIDYYDGFVDDFQVFNGVLTEVAILKYIGGNACVTDNQLVYLPFDSLTTGDTTFIDEAGGEDPGTCTGTSCPTSGLANPTIGYISLDGTNDFVNLDNPSTSSSTIFDAAFTTRTVMLCYYSTNTTPTQILYEEGGTVNGMNLYIDAGRVYGGGWANSNGFAGNWISNATTADTWHHVAIVYDNAGTTQMHFYYDGALVSSAAASAAMSSHSGNDAVGAMRNDTFLHSGSQSGDGFNFAGFINEFRVFSNALTLAEIQAYSNCEEPRLDP